MEEEEEGLGHEPHRGLKRLRLRGREVNQVSIDLYNIFQIRKLEYYDHAKIYSLLQSPNKEESPGLRAEDCQVSPQAAMKNKGKQLMIPEPEVPFSSSVAIPGNRLISERASPGVRIKEPMAESYLLITPKDEPFSDDMFMNDIPQFEVPIAVVHPGILFFPQFSFWAY